MQPNMNYNRVSATQCCYPIILGLIITFTFFAIIIFAILAQYLGLDSYFGLFILIVLMVSTSLFFILIIIYYINEILMLHNRDILPIA